MNSRKLFAGIILALTILFPFRLAFLDQPDMGPKSLLNFLMVLVGVALFAVLASDKDKSEMSAEKRHDQFAQKKAA